MLIDPRVTLQEQVPLDSPFSLHIYPIYACNFQCLYCLHSLSDNMLQERGFQKSIMAEGVFRKAIDSVKLLKSPLKATIFAGHGEPLLHKNIAQMVAYAKKSGVCGRVEVVTNGSMLTPQLSDRLIEAGLDRLRISVQGVTAQKYQEVCGVPLAMDHFINNIRYYYERKKAGQEIVAKIIDLAMDHPQDEETFHTLFGEICDRTLVEHVYPFVNEIDPNVYGVKRSANKHGDDILPSEICSMPFYMMVLAPNGDLLPCCSTEVPIVLGNISDTELPQIWNSAVHRQFLQMQLNNRYQNKTCAACSVPGQGLQQGDRLDDQRESLLCRLKDKENI